MKILFLLILLSGIISCKDEPTPDPGETEAPKLTQDINRFIRTVMEDVYLWYAQLPDIDIRYEFDPMTYFDKLLYTDDKFSSVTDDIQALENSFEGIEKSYGWSLAFGRFSDTQTIFALVEFVYPGTPADLAGAKRGDIIFEMNDADITDDNYLDLLNGDNMKFTYGQYVVGSGITNVKTANMTALQLNLNPVVLTNIIEEGGKKIGYLLYAQFIGTYNSDLDTVFQHFKDAGVTDLVVDFRYNPGGGIDAAQHLASILAPENVVNEQKTLVTYQWNDKYQEYWETNSVQNQLQVNFLNSVPIKMGFNKIHVITGIGTYSAPELVITGLKPYMDVVTVGETTGGKYLAGITLKPEDYYDSKSTYADFDTWGIYVMIIRYANSQGVTDFKDGISPDIAVDDDLFSPIPLGDKTEAMLKVAIEDITGTPIVAKKSAKIPDYEIFDRGFSRFDTFKQQGVLLNNIDKNGLLK